MRWMPRLSSSSSSTSSISFPTTWSTASTTSCSSSRTVRRTAASTCSGLYDGWALTERDRYGVGELPDRIIVYREPHLAACDDRGRTARRGPHDARARDRALLRHRRRPPARAGVGMMPRCWRRPRLDERPRAPTSTSDPDRPWQTVVWNDPVNLMSYVMHVFREYFGFRRARRGAAHARRAQRGPCRRRRGRARADGAPRPGHARLRALGDRSSRRRNDRARAPSCSR